MTELTFKGKEFVYNHHLSVPFRPLVPHADKGIGDVDLDGNLIIQGDNLHALKALLPRYAGKVDCIFIDPPYNTGNEGWAYNDNVNAPMIKEWLAANPIGIEDGLRHDKWCAMMWPRLRMLHELLADQGVLMVSIGDEEQARLTLMLRAIFGEESCLGSFVWRRRAGSAMSSEMVSKDHEYVLVYTKNASKAFILGDAKDDTKYNLLDENGKRYASMQLTVGMTAKMRPNQWYELVNPKTGKGYWPSEGRVWGYYPPTMAEKIKERRILFPDDFPELNRTRPRLKSYPEDAKRELKPTSTWLDGVGRTEEGTKLLQDIFGEVVFSYPKPMSLVSHLVRQFCPPDGLVLDSFSGSGTTAHAVLETNKRDSGNRKFVLVEMEDYADKLTAERVRRVINGYDYSGTQRTELLRETLNYRVLQKADELVQKVNAIENLHGQEYDKITKQVKDNELIVTGEKTVAERAEGLGGTFTYCTLGPPVELDKILTGRDLPSYDALGSVLYHMATNRTLESNAIRQADFHLGEHGNQHVWLIYKPELDWLKGPDAALTLGFARKIAVDYPGKDHLVFAASRFVSEKLLGEEGLRVEFVPLPFALYRIEKV